MNIDRVSGGILIKDENDNAFWTLSPGAPITGIGREVINLLWTMRCP
jgi:hypothetical protein